MHKAVMEGGSGGRVVTWRFMDAGLMVVRTCVQLPTGRETSMFWYLEAIDDPDLQPASLPGTHLEIWLWWQKLAGIANTWTGCLVVSCMPF